MCTDKFTVELFFKKIDKCWNCLHLIHQLFLLFHNAIFSLQLFSNSFFYVPSFFHPLLFQTILSIPPIMPILKKTFPMPLT